MALADYALAPARRGWHGMWLAIQHLAVQMPEEDGRAATHAHDLMEERFERFVRQFERQILNYLWRMTGDEELAFDLTQETFLRAWQHFATVSGYQQPRAWLFRVATNLALTQIQRRAAPVGAAVALDDANSPASSDPARRLVESELVRTTLLRLSPKRRAALVLREIYGLPCLEIAEALGMTLDAVKMALSRAREQFRAIYPRGEEGI